MFRRIITGAIAIVVLVAPAGLVDRFQGVLQGLSLIHI